MVSSTSFTDDILFEIFCYLPLYSIYMLKCLSKVWLSNLSHPNFIIKWFKINKKSLPLIHYHMINYQNIHTDENPLKFRIAYPELHSDFISKSQHLFSFEFLMNDEAFKGSNLSLLGSSNGLVLCLSVPIDFPNRDYHVCNPLTQEWVSLPPPPRSPPSYLDFNDIFCEYSSSFPSSYKVVRIPGTDNPSKKFYVDIFSSGLGEWESFEILRDDIFEFDFYNYYNVITLNGVLLWTEDDWDKMFVYDLDKHQFSTINMPDEEFYSEPNDYDGILGESEGLVCYARTKIKGSDMTVSVWVLDEVNWQILHHGIPIDGIFAYIPSQYREEVTRIHVLGFSPVDRNVVFLGCKHCVCCFNTRTRSFEELCLDNKQYGYDAGTICRPFVLTPMPTVLPPLSE